MAEDSSQEKEEAPSEKKRDDARKKGTVAKSTEVNSVFVLLTAIFLLRLVGPWMMREFDTHIRDYFALCSVADMSMQRLIDLSQGAIVLLIKVILPFAGAILCAGVLANVVQIGLLFTFEPMIPKLEKLNPLSGFKRIFSMRTVVETIKNILKIILIGYIAYATIKGEYEILITLADVSVMMIWQFVLASAYDIFLRTALVMLLIALADYGYQRYEHEKKLKMSHQEIKEEHKQMEGDPQVKARIRALQREMARRKMMDQVPQASVVVTNPTHLAIAMLYDESNGQAPTVVAKGKDLAALRIKKIAQENDVPIREDKLLARAMYDKVEVGSPIPEEFYMAVAEIMAWVYGLKGKKAV
ncbi:MAG: flagellar biosynthesis protein FlhB [Chitinispirillales bacterium]|jgi:flagellar biosynthetic protein FlhB|nr:flagellar biosynthesis protein FlhB [Chitinispirillales bacterium]